MGTELIKACAKEEDIDFPAIPPGFESYTPFKLKRVENKEKDISLSVSPILSESTVHMETETDQDDTGKISRSLRHRPSINYGQFDNSSDDECDSKLLHQKFTVRPSLPKGVIRGCSECQNCQKVIARWCPEAACRPDLEEVPIFYPNEEQFQDPIKYIAGIRPKAEPFGICRIVPPPSWKPPCRLKKKDIWESSTFATRVQRVDKLQNRDPSRKLSKIHNPVRKKRRCSRMDVDCGHDSATFLGLGEAGFGFEPGPEFTLDAIQRYANDFKVQYFRKTESNQHSGVNSTKLPEKWEPSVEAVEGEYWRVVEKPTEEIEVLYGADLETGVFGSGFPKVSDKACSSSDDEKYVKSGWNLNNLSRLPGSVLSYESADISGVQVPWLYIGMCFSSFCWHVEDHHLYSLNYMHFGAPKMWYGVPGKDATKLEEAMRKHLPGLFEEQPDLLHKLVTQLSPAVLKSDGVPVYRCIQNPGEFVLTFPRAYHSGFNCGFNCAEAVNVAPLDWFPHGQNAVELYRLQGRKTTISHDKLLLGAAREAVKANWELNLLKKNTIDNLKWKGICGKDGILAKSLRARVELESVRRECLCKSSKLLRMESSFDSTNERECSICFYDLHLSAAGCHCSRDRFACLNHAKQLCQCALSDKFFLFRYGIAELNLLVEAVEGKLSAVYRFARTYLGLSLSSFISKGNMRVAGLFGILSEDPEEIFLNEVYKSEENTGEISTDLTLNISNMSHFQAGNLSEAGSSVKEAKAPFGKSSWESIPTRNNLQFKKDHPHLSASGLSAPPHIRQVQKGLSRNQSSHGGKAEVTKSSYGQGDVICLSDDEGEQSNKPLADEMKQTTSRGCTKVSEIVVALATNRALSRKDGTDLFSEGKRSISLPCSASLIKETDAKCEIRPRSNQQNPSCHQGLEGTSINRNVQESSNSEGFNQFIEVATAGQLGGNVKDGTNIHKGETKIVEDSKPIPGSPSCSQNNLDKYYQQKGPRIAKVVRRINCNVESLEYGTVLSGKLWSSNQAIFPKGFKSRVRYIDVSDPTNMCYYVSEILDGGPKGPLFMVSLEHCPSEMFVHVSPTRCWEMVRERVNQEIAKQHKLGKMKLPPLQPPGSLDGLEMFGFTSPAIIQGIEALDKNSICREYWSGRPLAQMSQSGQRKESSHNLHVKTDEAVPEGKHPIIAGADVVLGGLFKKANPEELHLLLEMLSRERPVAEHEPVIRLLEEEIQNQSR